MRPYGSYADINIFLEDLTQKRLEDVAQIDAIYDSLQTGRVAIDSDFGGMLTIGASSGVAGSAPIKLTEGNLMTVAEKGAIEFNDGHLYFSEADNVRYGFSLSNGVKTDIAEVSDTTVETEIYSKSFAPDELHGHEVINTIISGVYSNASGSDDFTLRLKIDGTTIHSFPRLGGNVSGAGWQAEARFFIAEGGASGNYLSFFKYLEDGGSVYAKGDVAPSAIDTTVTHTLSVTVEWDNAKSGNTFYCTQGFIQFNH